MLDHSHDIGFRGGYQVATAMPLASSMSLDIRSDAANTILSGHARWWGFTEQRNVQRFPEPTTRKGLDRVIP
jgi:hypothetical protein